MVGNIPKFQLLLSPSMRGYLARSNPGQETFQSVAFRPMISKTAGTVAHLG